MYMWNIWGILCWREKNFVLKENLSLKDLPCKDMFTEDLNINMSDITVWQNPHQHFPFPCSLHLNLSFLSTLHHAFFLSLSFTQIFIPLLIPSDIIILFFPILTLSNIINNYLRNKLTLWMWNVFFFFCHNILHIAFWFKCKTWHIGKQRTKKHVVVISCVLASEDGLQGISL